MSNAARHFLSTSGLSGFSQKSERVFDKEALRVGEYKHPTKGWTLPVTRESIDRMVSTFNLMRENGIASNVTVDHSQSAKDRYGRVTAARREGDSLILTHDFTDDDGVKLAKRNEEVSIEIEPELFDGHGRKYDDAIVASSMVQHPVVPKQSPFIRIAASRQDNEPAGTTIGLPFHLSLESTPYPRREPPTTEDRKMELSKDQLQQVVTLTGLGADATEEDLATKLLSLAEAGKSATDQKSQIDVLTKKNLSLQAELDKAKPSVNPQLKSMQDQLIGQERERVEEGVTELIKLSLITPAEVKPLTEALSGTATDPNRLMLSRTAADKSPALKVINVLKSVDSAKLVEQRQKLGPQTMELSRNVPDDSEPSDDDVKSARDEAWGHLDQK